MKINFLGDSITYGVGASSPANCYVNLVSALSGVEVDNYGISGTRIARQSRPSADKTFDYDFLMRAEVMDKNADFVFVFGGTNDYGHGDAPVGKIGEKTPYTFLGAVSALIEYLRKIYGDNNICFILPARQFHEDDATGGGHRQLPAPDFKGYVDLLRGALQNYGVDYIDMYSHGLPKPETDGASEYFIDGLHPNDKGHRCIAQKISEYLANRFGLPR